MCVALPGQIIHIHHRSANTIPADVRFGDGVRRVDLVMTASADIGDYVIAHAGLSIRVVSQTEARRAAELWSVDWVEPEP